MRPNHAGRLALLALVPVIALAGCGGDDDEESASGTGGETQTLTVGVIPIIDIAPLYLGMEQGFFEEQNLEIEPQFAEGGAAITPSVQSGEFDLGMGNTVSTIIATSKGLPFRMIAPVMKETTESPAYSAVLVGSDSRIEAPADLAGKKIAVNTLQNIGTLTIQASLEKEGVDASSVQFVEIPFPEMAAALDAGRVDAIWVVEPFTTLSKQQGARAVLEPLDATAEKLTIGTWFTTQPWIDENQDAADAFAAAIEKSNAYAAEHPDEAREIVTTYTEIEPAVAEEMVLGDWSSDFNRDAIELLGQLAEEDGLIEEQPDYDELILDE